MLANLRRLWHDPPPPGPTPYRARLYRALLLLAAAYNAAFGLWAGLWPRSFFDVFGLAQPTYPAIWQCVGMVVGVYALLYAYGALRLDLARPYVAVGLLGKILGPLGWLVTISSGQWPARTFSLIVFNDLIWWAPFTLFLLEGTRLGDRVRSAAPFVCAGLNLLGGAALALVLRPGTEVVANPLERAAYITQHPALWRGGWLVWMAAALSLLGFYAWWGGRPGLPRWAVAGFWLAAAGLLFDFLAESLYIGWLPEQLVSIQRLGTLLSGGVANGLYTLGGLTLTLASPWGRVAGPRAGRRAWTRAWQPVLAWAAWAAGLALSLAAVFNFVPGLVLAGAALVICFCPFALMMGLSKA
jgi:hypothetical protein